MCFLLHSRKSTQLASIPLKSEMPGNANGNASFRTNTKTLNIPRSLEIKMKNEYKPHMHGNLRTNSSSFFWLMHAFFPEICVTRASTRSKNSLAKPQSTKTGIQPGDLKQK